MSKSLQVGNTIEPEIRLHHTGDEYFDSALECIRSAQSEILFESYIFENDPIGRAFLEELSNAAERGVHVYLLVDAIGSFNFIRNPPPEIRNQQIHFRVYHPLPFQERWSWTRLQKFFFFLRRINKRNHRKMIIVDQKTAFVGSCNISAVHSQRYFGPHAWRDTQVSFSFPKPDPEVLLLREVFMDAWRRARRRDAFKNAKRLRKPDYWKQPQSRFFRLNSRIHWRFAHLHKLNQRISEAKSRVLITNAYFVPQRSLFNALCFAAQKGVEVVLCLPKKSDVWIVLQASRVLYRRLLREGVKIYEYEPSVLHAKCIIIDDNWAAVGSHNLNHRSFFHDLEVQAILTEPRLIGQMLEQWNVDVQNSHQLSLSDLNKISILNKIISNIIYWFRYWL